MCQQRGLMPGDTAYSAAISACEKGPEKQQDTMLLNQIHHRGLMPGDTAYSAAVSACEKGLEEQQDNDTQSDTPPRTHAR